MLRAFLLIAVAIGAFWLGLNDASASCGYDYNAGYPWFVSTQCWYDIDCDDLSGETCWEEDCQSACVDGQTWGYIYTQRYGCDDNCGLYWLQNCDECN